MKRIKKLTINFTNFNMSYIITIRIKESILMASDTRLNYHYDKEINGEKFQVIIAVADCIRKTFFIDKAKIGIQFLGIGYFPDDDGEEYPLSHFVRKLYDEKYSENFKKNAQIIFDFFKKISKEGDTGRYVKGIMAGFSENNKSYVCIFNTYNNDFEIKELNVGQFIDSENNKTQFPCGREEAIEEINKRITRKSKEKFRIIGGPIEILEITPEKALFIQESKNLFEGSKRELVKCLEINPQKINGYILPQPHFEKYRF